MVKNLVPDIRKNMHVIAQEEVEIERLDKQITQTSATHGKGSGRNHEAQDRFGHGPARLSLCRPQLHGASRSRSIWPIVSSATRPTTPRWPACATFRPPAARAWTPPGKSWKACWPPSVSWKSTWRTSKPGSRWWRSPKRRATFNIDDSELGRVKELIAEVRTRLNVAERLVNTQVRLGRARFRFRRRSRTTSSTRSPSTFGTGKRHGAESGRVHTPAQLTSVEAGDSHRECAQALAATPRDVPGALARGKWCPDNASSWARRGCWTRRQTGMRSAAGIRNHVQLRPAPVDRFGSLRTMDRKCREEPSCQISSAVVGRCGGRVLRLSGRGGAAGAGGAGQQRWTCRCWPICRGITPRFAATRRVIRSNRLRDVWLNHRKIDTVSWINDGSLIELGPCLANAFQPPASAERHGAARFRQQPSHAALGARPCC